MPRASYSPESEPFPLGGEDNLGVMRGMKDLGALESLLDLAPVLLAHWNRDARLDGAVHVEPHHGDDDARREAIALERDGARQLGRRDLEVVRDRGEQPSFSVQTSSREAWGVTSYFAMSPPVSRDTATERGLSGRSS